MPDSTADIPVGLFPATELPRRPWMPRKGGKTVSIRAVWRWLSSGMGGVTLRSMLIGGTRYTTDAWAVEFFEQTSQKQPQNRGRTPSRRLREMRRAERELETAGI